MSFLNDQEFVWSHTIHEVDSVPLEESIRLVFVNGYFSQKLSDLHLLPDSVTLLTLADALTSHEELIRADRNRNAVESAHGAAGKRLHETAAIDGDGVMPACRSADTVAGRAVRHRGAVSHDTLQRQSTPRGANAAASPPS